MPERDKFPSGWTEDMIDAFIAEKQDACEGGHIENGPGRLILEKGGHVSNPGVINDWMNLINTGARPTATGNSDSHSLGEELGSPRNFIRLRSGHLTPSAAIMKLVMLPTSTSSKVSRTIGSF